MDSDAKLVLWTAVVVAVVAVVIVRAWPYRRFREISVQRRIAAPPQRIWDAYRCDPDDPVSAGFHDTVEHSYVVSENPKTVDLVVHSGDRSSPVEIVVRSEMLAEEPPYRMASRCLSVNGKPLPFGERNCEAFTQVQDGGEMMVTISWRGETATLGQHLGMRRFMTRTIDRLKSYCETGEGSMMPKPSRSPWKSLGLTMLAFGSFSFLFGWIAAIILSVAIVIHEFGHWLAMRMTGQPNPRIMLVPFFGGVAVPNKPYKSQFDDAFVSLMGAGISVVPCLALLGAAFLVGEPAYAEAPKFGKFSGPGLAVDRLLYLLASLVGLMNAVQLIPVLPLDGGHVLRSVIQSTSVRRARPILLGLTGTGMAGFAVLGDYVLVAILALGAMQAWYLGDEKPKAGPMGGAGIAAISIGYAVVFCVHAGAVVITMRVLGINLFQL